MAVVPVETVVGGGTAPNARLKSYAVSIQHRRLGANELLKKLRLFDPPIVGRIAEDTVVLDLRTVPAREDEIIARALEQL